MDRCAKFYNRHRKPIIIFLGLSLAVATAWTLKGEVRVGRVNGDSMYPSLEDGDLFIFREREEYNRGDVVVFYPPAEAVLEGEDGSTFIKRIVATANDHIKIDGNTLYINGVKTEEPYIKERFNDIEIDETVPEGKVFVLGDNRDESRDSRHYGTIDVTSIAGKAEDFCIRK